METGCLSRYEPSKQVPLSQILYSTECFQQQNEIYNTLIRGMQVNEMNKCLSWFCVFVRRIRKENSLYMKMKISKLSALKAGLDSCHYYLTNYTKTNTIRLRHP